MRKTKIDDTAKLDKEIRHYIYKTFAEITRPPTTEEVAKHLKKDILSIEQSFKRLAYAHQIVLAPGSYTIWMAHPFSSLPTNYTVAIGSKKYFANWVWDIFGISAILQMNAKGHTPCGCGECNEELNFPIRVNQNMESDWIVHFLVPPKKFWESIGFTWATILAFSSEAHLDHWLKRNRKKKGGTMPIGLCNELATQWYPGRNKKNWKRPGAEETQNMFSSLSLVGEFWNLQWKHIT